MTSDEVEVAASAGNGHVGYWWTHGTLQQEVPTPDLTGVEAAMTTLQEIRSRTEEQVVAHTAELMEHVTRIEAAKTTLQESEVSDDTLLMNATWQQWSAFLPEALSRLHTALAQTWRERDMNSHTASDTQLVESKADIITESGNAGSNTCEPRSQQESREVERLVYTSFFRAVLQGLRSAVWRVVQTSSTEEDVEEHKESKDGHSETHDRFSALLGVLLDQLFCQLCFSTSTSGSEVNRRMCFHVHSYLKQELQLSPVERAVYLPGLTHQAKRILEHELSSWVDTTPVVKEETADASSDNDVSDVVFVRRSVDYMRALLSGLRCRDEARLFYEYDESTESSRLSSCQTWLALALLLPMTTSDDAAWLYAWLQRWLLHAVDKCMTNIKSSDTTTNTTSAENSAVMQRLHGRLARHAMQAIPLLMSYPGCACYLTRFVELFAGTFYRESSCAARGEVTHDSRRRCLRQCHALLIQQQQQQLSNGNGVHFYPEIEKSGGGGLVEACQRRVQYSLARLHTTTTTNNAEGRQNEWQSEESIAALAYALLLSPLAILELLFRHTSSAQSIRLQCSADGVFCERGSAEVKSEARAKAYEEHNETPMTRSALLTLFFPRFYAVFDYLEHALHYLLTRIPSGQQNNDTQSDTHFVLYIAACLDEAFWLGLTDCDESAAVAASELLMFYALLCSDKMDTTNSGSTQGSCVAELPLLQSAVRHFFGANEAQMLRYVYDGVMTHNLYGLLGFFLPLLRSLGVDTISPARSDIGDFEQRAALALHFPWSARVAFLQELPRLYFCIPCAGVSLARRAADDALVFFHRMLFTNTNTSTEEEKISVRGHFVALLKKAGARVAGRVLSGSAGVAPDENGVGNDVTAAFFFGVLRLCREVGVGEDTGSKEEVIMSTEKTQENDSRNAPTRVQWRQLYEELVQACETTDTGRLIQYVLPMSREINDKKDAALPVKEEHCENNAMDEPVQDKTNGEDTKPLPQSWLRCFWQVDYCDIESEDDARDTEGQPQQQQQLPTLRAAKALLRSCTVSYAQHLSPKTLLALRALFEHAAAAQRDEHASPQAKHRRLADAAVHDLQALAASSSVPLTFEAIEPYMRDLCAALLTRSCMSPSDAACAGRALRLFLTTASAHKLVEGGALVHTLWRFVYSVTVRLRQCTHAEAIALSVLLHDLIEHVILPYKLSFAASNAKRESDETVTNIQSSAWYSEKESDANQLLQNAMSDCSKTIVTLLTRHTLLSDWCAYVVALHCKSILGLVTRYWSTVQTVIAERRAVLSRTKVVSPGFLLLLNKVEYPLAPGMSSRAAEVRQLYVPDTATRTATNTAANAPTTTTSNTSITTGSSVTKPAQPPSYTANVTQNSGNSRTNTMNSNNTLPRYTATTTNISGGRSDDTYSRRESNYASRGEYERRSSQYHSKRERDGQEGDRRKDGDVNEDEEDSRRHHRYRGSRRYEKSSKSGAGASSERHGHGRSRHGSRSRRGDTRSRR